ncbi:hypothetical protein BH23BAC3_BH23BAC3_17930 [soil metagenome]
MPAISAIYHYLIRKVRFIYLSLGNVMAIFALVLAISIGQVQLLYATDDPKLVLIHMDAVSLHVLQEEIEAGNLPQIENYFKETGLLERAITYYPSKTPFVVSNIRDATPSSEGKLVGWEIPVFDENKSLSFVDSFLMMALSKHRPARANLIYGLPIFNRLNKLALMNTLDLFDEYPVIEFYWYAIDSSGHFYGEKKYRAKLREFDAALGKYLSRLDENINVIIYADHGMVFGEGVEINKIAREKFGDKIKAFSYPSVYLFDDVDTDETAKRLVHETELDFVFFMHEDDMAKGYSKNGTFYLFHQNNTIRYTYEGMDSFEYYKNGYNGEYLSADEWLMFSANLSYPATPIMVYNYLSNPNSGDIVTSFNDEKYAKTSYSSEGNHGGFTATDVKVPVLVRGPNVDYIGDFELLWLQELFNEIQDFEFKQNPARDRHYLSSRYNFRNESTSVTVALSPVYRSNFGTDILFDDFSSPLLETVWGRYDLYRSYLARLWFGAGVDFRKEDTVGMLFLKHEFRIRNLTTRTTLTTSGIHHFTLGYRIFPHITAEFTNFSGLGLRISL